jgi:hypothetical protein
MSRTFKPVGLEPETKIVVERIAVDERPGTLSVYTQGVCQSASTNDRQ